MPGSSKYHNGSFNSNGFNSGGRSSMFAKNQEGSNGNELDLKKVFYTLWNRKWIIVGSILVCGFLAGLIAYFSTPIYQSKGSMLIEESKGGNAFGGSSEGLGQLLSSTYGIGAGSTLANELQVLQSRKLSKAIADSLMKERIMPNGSQFPILFKSYPDDSTLVSLDRVAYRVRKNSAFQRVNRDANVVAISYQSPSPYEAAHIVNMSMKSYKALSTRENRSSASSAVTFLEKERNRIKSKLQDAEEKLRKFMNHSKVVQVDSQTKQLIEEMANLESERQKAKAKLVAANSAIQQYQKKLNDIKPGLANQYANAVSPNISKLQYAESELEIQKQQLLANNPNLKSSSPRLHSINKKINNYKNRIDQLTQSLIKKNDQYLGFLAGSDKVAENISDLNQQLIQMQVQRKQYNSQVKVLNKQLAQEKKFFNNLPDNIIKLAKRKRDVKINEKLYETVSQQYAETSLWKQTQFGLGRIIDNGFIPKNPVSPRTNLYILLGFILGGIASMGYVLVADSLNTDIDSVEKMRTLDEPLLSVVPTMDDYIENQHNGAEETSVQGYQVSTSLITVLDTISPISESFRKLQSNLIYSNPDTKLKNIMFTSSGKGEGKTTTIANLGVTLAEAGHDTVIVDVDFRRPNLHNMFGFNKTPGFVEVLFDDIRLEDGLKKTFVPGLSILPAGRKPPNASAISQSRALLEVLREIENRFDFVLIDTAPLGIINDASALIRHIDEVVVVAKFNETTEVQLDQTLDQLHHLNANVAGTVLTAFNHEESTDYYLSSDYYKKVYKDYNEYKNES